VKEFRSRLTYANVMSTIGVFLLLGTGAALAADQVLPKKSVGTKQLKTGAVTAAKLKKSAVTKVKIKNGAVDGSKIKDGSVTGSEIDPATTPFSRIVYSARGSGPVAASQEEPVPYPLVNPTYTQEPGRDDTLVGVVDFTFDPACKPPRVAVAYLLLDPQSPNEVPSESNVSGVGYFYDATGARASGRAEIGSSLGSVRFQQSVPTDHTISLAVGVDCDSGNGATATAAAVDVIGTK
jgi:hypothetical protein